MDGKFDKQTTNVKTALKKLVSALVTNHNNKNGFIGIEDKYYQFTISKKTGGDKKVTIKGNEIDDNNDLSNLNLSEKFDIEVCYRGDLGIGTSYDFLNSVNQDKGNPIDNNNLTKRFAKDRTPTCCDISALQDCIELKNLDLKNLKELAESAEKVATNQNKDLGR